MYVDGVQACGDFDHPGSSPCLARPRMSHAPLTTRPFAGMSPREKFYNHITKLLFLLTFNLSNSIPSLPGHQ